METSKEKADYFDVPDIDTTTKRNNNTHYWLQQDILQSTTFQTKFFQNVILNDDTLPQIKLFSHFLLNYFRFKYQLLWEPKYQNAYINFPHVLTKIGLLPFIIVNDFKHSLYKDLTTFPIPYFEHIILKPAFLVEQSNF